MTIETVPQTLAGPPGYCGAIADELRRLAAALDSVGHHELPDPSYVHLWIQPYGQTDDEKIAGVDILGQALCGVVGTPYEVDGGGFHYDAEGPARPVTVKVFKRISAERGRQILAEREAADKDAELRELRRRIAELEASTDRPDPTGLGYSRADSDEDDPTPVSPARGLHAGAVTDDSLVPKPIAAHYETDSWKHAEFGDFGVECACGATFNGFDTPAKAAAQLARHIEAANALYVSGAR